MCEAWRLGGRTHLIVGSGHCWNDVIAGGLAYSPSQVLSRVTLGATGELPARCCCFPEPYARQTTHTDTRPAARERCSGMARDVLALSSLSPGKLDYMHMTTCSAGYLAQRLYCSRVSVSLMMMMSDDTPTVEREGGGYTRLLIHDCHRRPAKTEVGEDRRRTPPPDETVSPDVAGCRHMSTQCHHL